MRPARLSLLRALGGCTVIAPGPPIHIGCEQCDWQGRFNSQNDAVNTFLRHRSEAH